ncbi:MAG: amino acid ABC transporter permease [Halanaerobium sp.]|nr:amino acid ABC transporter permease [Halanaerobium sp.]
MNKIDKLQLIWASLPALLEGALVTIELTVFGLGLGLLLALPLSFGQIYGSLLVRSLVSIYERILRSIPLLVILFLIFYGFPRVGIRFSPFIACVLGIGLRSSAYQSQIFRGAIQSVEGGQLKAALSLGMSRMKAFIFIILPQAIRIAIPPWANEFTIVLKDSSMAYALGVIELLRQGRYIISTSYEPMVIFITVAVIYFGMTIIINNGLGRLEDRLQIPGFKLEESSL